MATTRLRRHQLAYLTAQGWAQVLQTPLAADARALAQIWADRRLPLVVTRQCEARAAGEISLGCPAPLEHGRMRLALQVPARSVGWLDEFPDASAVGRLLPHASRTAAGELLTALTRAGARPRVYGSYGWQLLTGFEYVHAASDLDLWMRADSLVAADTVVALLQAAAPMKVRVDGEIAFPEGTAVSWREYAAWRSGRSRGMLVKRLESVAVETELHLPAWCEAAA